MTPISEPTSDVVAKADAKIASFQKGIADWEKKVSSLINEKSKSEAPEAKKEMQELSRLQNFIGGRLTKRLEALTTLSNHEKCKQLQFLEGHYEPEKLNRFITQFFDVELFKGVRLNFKAKKDFEREVNILFDLYKVKRTIETITTMEKKLDEPEPFPSSFTVEERKEHLKVLREIMKLFFIRFVKKEYRTEVYQSLSEAKLDTGYLVQMHQRGESYINPEVISGEDYRAKFIMLLFATEIRTIVNKQVEDCPFNYTHFEMIKNDFLVHWMQSKLSGNDVKEKVFKKYRIGGKSIAELIQANPEKEAEILQALPVGAFNDIAEELNQKVDESLKAPVATFSKTFGLFARLETSFTEIKKVARFSVEKMQEVADKNKKIWTVRGKKPVAKAPVAKKPVAQVAAKEKPVEKFASPFELSVLKNEDIAFPFYHENDQVYQKRLEFLHRRMDKFYQSFQNNVWALFNFIAEEQIIIRNEPTVEWTIPFVFAHGKEQHLLIVGADISVKDQKAGYKSKWHEDLYSLNAYFIYATATQNDKLGKITGKRMVQNSEFFQYASAEPDVQKEALKFFTMILKNRKEPIFKASSVQYREKNKPFKELESLSKLPGIGPKKKTASENPETISGGPETPAESGNKAEIPAKHPVEKKPELKDVAAQIKEEMAQAKADGDKELEAIRARQPKSIANVAADLKAEMDAAKAEAAGSETPGPGQS